MIKYTWDIVSLTKRDYPELKLTDVVVGVNWTRTGTDENGVSATYACESSVPPPVDPANFSDLDDLTEEQVIEWVAAQVPVEVIDAGIAEDIAKASAPPLVVVPWNKAKVAAKKVSKKKSK